MAKGEVTVVINGQETVSEATSSADASLGGFVGKIPGWGKAVAALAVAYHAIASAVGAAKDFVLNSIDAYDKFAASQRKLEGTAKLSGIALGALRDIADTGRTAFGLAAGTSNEFASEIGKLTSKSGDITKSKDAMAAFLDIGAARGLSAADTLKAVQQAVLGIDEGTDKLFGKNPSVLYEEYADKIGKSAGKLTDQEKAQALLDATLTGGEATRGSYLEYLQSAAGQQEQVNQKVEASQVEFGKAIQPIRTLILQGLNKLLEVLIPVAEWVGKVSNTVGVTAVQAFNKWREGVGTMYEVIGRITGIKSLEEWGKRQADTARESFAAVEETAKKAGQTIKTATSDAATSTTTAHEKMGKAAKDSSEISQKAADAYFEKASAKLGKPLAQTIGLTEGAIIKLADAAKQQLPPETAAQFLTHMEGLAKQAEVAREKMVGLGDKTQSASKNTKDAADDVGRVARAALDAAVAFGVIEESAANTLNSVINIAAGIAGVVSGDVTSGVAAILSGLTNVVASMLGGDAERKRLLRQNNEALDRLRKDIGGLNLRITGEDLVNAQTALEGVVDQLKGGRGGANERDVRNALYAQGLSMEDFERIAKEFGIEVRTKSGALNVDSVKAVLEALKTVQLGKVGGDFQSQLDFFQEGQDINGEEGAARATNLLKFLRAKGKVRALDGLDLSDPTKLREQLLALRAQLNSDAGIDESQLGALSGGQFNDLLVSILGMLTGGAAPGGDVTVPDGTGGSATGGGGASVPTETIQNVIKAMDNNLANILTTHTTIHERIAAATEGSHQRLISIDTKMDDLILVTAGQIDATDAKLETMRRMAGLERGQRPEFT